MKLLLLLSLVVLVGCDGRVIGTDSRPCDAGGETLTNHCFGKWSVGTNTGYQYRSCERCGRTQWDDVWRP